MYANSISHSLRPARPHLGDVGIIALVPEAWDNPWTVRHHVLIRLARYFNVVWVNPAREWREMLFGRSATGNSADRAKAVGSGFAVYDPGALLPKLYKPARLARFLETRRLELARRSLIRRGCRAVVLYIWRPEHATAMKLVRSDVSCYHIDDEYTFSEVEMPLGNHEARLISRVDQVFIHSPALLSKKGRGNPNTLLVPNGVDYRLYATPNVEPEDLKAIPHPRIGYVGYVKRHLDLELLATLAQRHRSWSFVLVGPIQDSLCRVQTPIRQLQAAPNVHFLGCRPVETLPGYTQHMDVCILCYKINGYTRFIYPMKLHEYLAAGCPVVGSPIPSLQGFSNVVKLAKTANQWSCALAESLLPAARSARRVEARRRVARQHDWNKLTAVIAEAICARLGPSYAERFARIPHDTANAHLGGKDRPAKLALAGS